jgi:hypothetical protein
MINLSINNVDIKARHINSVLCKTYCGPAVSMTLKQVIAQHEGQ